jgi:hypothetical protein
MNRLMIGVAAIVAAVSGCATPAHYVEKHGTESGVVAIPADSDVFPTYYRTEAMDLIRRHVGSNFEIVEERQVETGQLAVNNQHVNNDDMFKSQTVKNTTTTQNVYEWHIVYRKKPSPVRGDGMQLGAAGGLTPAGGAAAGAGGVKPADGIVPPVGPLAPGPIPVGSKSTTGSGVGISGSTDVFLGKMN